MRGMKKILALLLCMVMVLSSVPAVFAASGDLLQPGNSGWSEDADPEATQPDGSIDIPIEDLFVKVVGIEVATAPTKTVYERGEELDTTGLTLTAAKSNGTTATVTDGFTVSGFESETIGVKTVTVEYAKFTATFEVEVVAAATRLIVSPSKTDVKWGDELDVIVSITGDYEFTSFGYMPVVNSPAYEIIDAESLVTGAMLSEATLDEGGVLLFVDSVAYNGDLFRFTIRIKDKGTLGQIAFTEEFSLMNETSKVAASLKETYITVSAPEITAPEVDDTPVEDLDVKVNEEESGIVVGGKTDSTVTDVVIKDSYVVNGDQKPVTEIAPEAFKDNTTVQTVVIPSTVTTVGQDAFAGSAVKEVTVKGTKTDISNSGIKDVENVTIVAPIGSAAHDYAKEHNLTFRALLSFYSASVVLTDDLGLRYKVSDELFTAHGYTNPYVIFEINGKKVPATSEMVVDGLHIFSYLDIAPHMVKDKLTGTLYATDADGYLCSSEPREYSIKNYCHDMLDHKDTAGNAELQTLLVDMLNYGAAAQKYIGYHTEDLANKELTDAEKELGTQEAPASENKLNTAVATPEKVKATFKGAGLYLEETVALRFGFAASSTKGLSVKVNYKDNKGNAQVKEFTEKDFVKSGSVYYVYFKELIASQMRQVVSATICEGDTAVSNTVEYSIESYVAQAQAYPQLVDIVNAVLAYGDSAEAYANK